MNKRRLAKIWRRYSQNKGLYFAALAIIAVFVIAKIHNPERPVVIDPQSYRTLLDTIAKGESNGNYNAHYGNAANTEVQFTKMTIAQVQKWQEQYVKTGSPSSAVGRYQIIRTTLNGLVKQLNLPTEAVFDEALQDRMAITLLERRGSLAFAGNKLTREQFAANIAQEWAALPKATGDNPDQSYYAGDGLNKSRIKLDDVYVALQYLEI